MINYGLSRMKQLREVMLRDPEATQKKSLHSGGGLKSLLTRILFLVTCYSLLVTFLGCEAFVRKFTRKPKKEEETVQMVLAPESYTGIQMSKEELYRQYFLFWKSWQDELINSLYASSSHKKHVECIEQAIVNLKNLSLLLNEEKQKKLEPYLSQSEALANEVKKDIYGNFAAENRRGAENLKRNILRDFSFQKVKDSLL